MKTIVSRLMLAAVVSASFAALPACPAEEPKVETPPPPPPPPPPSAPTPTIPEYAPTGDDADLKKQGAAGIDASNAAAKAAETEAALDKAIADLEAKKAETATKK